MRFFPAGGVVVLALALSSGLACSRQQDVEASTHPEQSLPFDQAPDRRGISPTAYLTPSEIPAGTVITIRLQSALSSSRSQEGDSFEALLDEPVLVQTQTVIPSGGVVSGKVAAAKSAGSLKDPGYLRLVLATLSVNGKPLAVRSSSVFVKGGSANSNIAMETGSAQPVAPKEAHFAAGQRITFRLTEPLPLSN